MPSRFSSIRQSLPQSVSVGRTGLALLILCSATASANWRAVPEAGAGVEYDDNTTLSVNTGQDTSVNGYVVDAGVDFINESPVSTFTFSPRGLFSRYDESTFDSNDYFADLNYSYTGQRSTFNIWSTYGNETVRRAEQAGVDFNVQDPTQIPDDNSGRTFGTAKRQRVQFRPQWTYQAGQKSQIQLTLDYRNVTFDQNATTIYSDYDQTTGSAEYSYKFSPRSAFRFGGYYRQNHFTLFDRDLNGHGAAVGIDHSISENTSLQINAGVDSTEDGLGENQNSPIGDISLIHTMETSRLLASYRRTVAGSSNGILQVRDSINLYYTRQVTQRFSIGGGVSAYHAGAVGNAATDLDRDYYQIRALFTWNFTRTLSMDLDYRYTNIDRASETGTASSNLANLWFRYTGLR